MEKEMDKGLYFHWLNETLLNEPKLNQLRQYAALNDVPIIQDEGIVFLKQLINLTNSKKILEIGTAIGYSAIHMVLDDPSIHVTTIERDPLMASKARENTADFGLTEQINLIEADALDFDCSSLANDYDLLFIDAAKSQYIKFFQKYSACIKQKGVVFTDNLLFHGLIFEPTIKNRSLRQLVDKIKKYNGWLKDQTTYSTVFYQIGDGIAVSIKK
jgi:predicted O-methyltransferase YrrM